MEERTIPRYSRCRICGRTCGVDRTSGKAGFCGEDSRLRLAWAGIHRGEEPPICGKGGSGTVFFSGCTLKCFFCQNHQISRGGIGRVVSNEEFASICLTLQARGAENVNLVTPSHFIPSVAEGLSLAEKEGLEIPVLWNSSGYDSVDALESVDPFLDVYLPDLKTVDPSVSAALFGLPDYPDVSKESLLWMVERHPLRFRGDSLVSGVIVRHLVFPGLLPSTEKTLAWFAENLAGRALLSVMFQYTPVFLPAAGRGDHPGDWDRRISREEYDEVLACLDRYGIEDGFVQELSDEESLLPDFSKEAAFPPELASCVWFHGGRE